MHRLLLVTLSIMLLTGCGSILQQRGGEDDRREEHPTDPAADEPNAVPQSHRKVVPYSDIVRDWHVDHELLMYVERFQSLFNIADIPFDIHIVDTFDENFVIPDPSSGRIVGVCSHNMRRIEILAAFFDEASDYRREALLFHELGHCVGNLSHKNETFKSHRRVYKIPYTDTDIINVPVSVMHSMLIRQEIYATDYARYRDELRESMLEKSDTVGLIAGQRKDIACPFSH